MSSLFVREVKTRVSLPLRPARSVGESENGHTLRVANRNGLSGRALLNHGKLPLRHGLSKFCPECLNEKGQFQQCWDQDDSLWCETHQAWLIDACPKCCSPLRWQREELLRCDCGQHLMHVAGTPLTEWDSATLQWLKGERKRAAGLPRIGKAGRLNLTVLIGAYVSTSGLDTPLHKRHGRSVESRRLLLVRGLEQLQNWPHRFNQFLEDLYWRSACALPRSKESLLFLAFGRQLRRLCRNHPTDPVLTRYLSLQELYAKRAHNKRHSTLTAEVRDQNRWVTRREAASILGIHASVLDRLIQDQHVLVCQRPTPKGRTITAVELTSLYRLCDQHGALRNGLGMADVLGLSKRQFRDLLLTGFCCPILGPRYPGDVAFYSEKEAIMLVNRLETVAMPSLPADPVNLDWVYRFVHLPDQNLLAWLLPHVWSKSLRTYLSPSGKPGLASFCWSKQEVLALAKQDRSEKTVGVTDLAAELHMKPEVLNHLTRCGTFQLSDLHDVSRADAQRAKQEFERGYVLLSQVARVRDMSPRWLATLLAKKGINPVHGPTVDGCRMNIYLRSELPKSLLEGVKP